MSDAPGSGNLDLRPMKIMTVPSQVPEHELRSSILKSMAGAQVFPVLRQVSISVPNSDATGRIMRLLSGTFARMSLIVRGCVGRERARQAAFRNENKLPKSAKLPYEPQSLTDVEQAEIRVSVETVRGLFGDVPADYAWEKALHTVSTGDLRAFKIRLLFLKVRDSLKGSQMYHEFLQGVSDAISASEEMAGCKPDNSPRRLSKAEQERKRRIQAKIEAERRVQPELPLEWPSGNSNKPLQDIENIESEHVVNNGDKCGRQESSEEGESQYIEKEASGVENYDESKIDKNEEDEEIKSEENFTVKEEEEKRKFYSKKTCQDGLPVRKAREYDTVEQILDDIESGAIVRYESTDEIKDDLKAGRITTVEALMFTAALDRYCESDMYEGDDEEDEELEREFEEACDAGEFPEDEDGEDDFEFDDEYRRRGCGDGPSYNPRGFSGIGGRCSASGDWDMDDAW